MKSIQVSVNKLNGSQAVTFFHHMCNNKLTLWVCSLVRLRNFPGANLTNFNRGMPDSLTKILKLKINHIL